MWFFYIISLQFILTSDDDSMVEDDIDLEINNNLNKLISKWSTNKIARERVLKDIFLIDKIYKNLYEMVSQYSQKIMKGSNRGDGDKQWESRIVRDGRCVGDRGILEMLLHLKGATLYNTNWGHLFEGTKRRRQKKWYFWVVPTTKWPNPPSCGQSTTFLWEIFYLLRIPWYGKIIEQIGKWNFHPLPPPQPKLGQVKVHCQSQSKTQPKTG